jgi:hypothetical protein
MLRLYPYNSEIPMFEPGRLAQLQDENGKLRIANSHLKVELEFLRMHPVFLAGLTGETLICKLVDGILTSFAESYDIKAGEIKIEVKYSNLGVAVKGANTFRWSRSKPFGWKDKGKIYDFLVLIGQKDDRFPEQYLDDTRYVCFLIPRKDVEKIMVKGASIGGMIQITTNFKLLSNPRSKLLLSYLKRIDEILELIKTADPKLHSPVDVLHSL